MKQTYATAPLREVLLPVSRPEKVDPERIYQILGARWYARGLYTKEVKPGSEIRAKELYRVEEGDFVYNRLFGWKGSFAVASKANHGCYVSNEFPCFRVDDQRADAKFLWRYFSQESSWNRALGLSFGATPTSRNRLKEDQFLSIKVPLPPLAEQRRIVARIEALALKIAEARELRQRAAEEVEVLTRSELAAIVNSLVIEVGTRRLGDLIVNADYGTSTKCTFDRWVESVPVLRIPNVAFERVNFDDLKFGALRQSELEGALLTEGDVLIVRTNGSADLVGRSAVVPPLAEPTAFASYMIRLHCDRHVITPEYLQLMLKHLRTDGQLIDFARTTAGQYNVSLGRLRVAELPVPSLAEQRRIVAYLDNLQAKVDVLKKMQEETAKELNALMPSILSKSFAGEL